MCVPIKNIGETGLPKAQFSADDAIVRDARHGTSEFGVCPVQLQSCFVPIFSCHISIHPYLNGKVYPMPFNFGSM